MQPGRNKEYTYTHGYLIDENAKPWQNKPMHLWFIASKNTELANTLSDYFKQGKNVEQAYDQLLQNICHKNNPTFTMYGLLATISKDRQRHKVDTQNFTFTESKKSKCRFFGYLKKEAILNQLYYALRNKHKTHKVRGCSNIIETTIVPYVAQTQNSVCLQQWQQAANAFFSATHKDDKNYNPLGLLMIDSQAYFDSINTSN